MIKNIMFIIVGLFLGTVISTASAALFESGSASAKPIVGYGKTTAGAIVAVQVDSSGVLQTN